MHAQHLIAKVKKHQLWRVTVNGEGRKKKNRNNKQKKKDNKSQHMLKIFWSQRQQEHHRQRRHNIKTNFGPLKHETEQVLNQNI